MQEVSDVPSGYLQQPPDFASHSPFAGATWFAPYTAKRNSA
jgi:hypothetical protein